MIGAGVIEWWLGVDAEQESLENVATPVSAKEAEGTSEQPERPRRRRSSGRSQWAPRPAYSAVEGSPGVEQEIQRMQAILQEHGQLSRDRLAQLTGARLWGPGCLNRALAEAIADGRVRRVGRNRYEAASIERRKELVGTGD
jgi:hypothetical protein